MILSKTPYRISFFGGGSDFREFYEQHGGKVLSATINHYCRIMVRRLPPFFTEKSRVIWSQIENVSDICYITHPAARAILYHMAEDRIEIIHSGDLPARSGLGSSSAFTVGLLNAMHALRMPHYALPDLNGLSLAPKHLATEAICIERDILRENVGIQDQIACTYGGFNKTTIHTDGAFTLDPLKPDKALQDHLLLFFTGITRNSSDIAAQQIKEIHTKTADLKHLMSLVDTALASPLEDFGRLLHESWLIKRKLSPSITTDFIDGIYTKALNAGAEGGKLLGAGGGGFMLFFAKPEYHKHIIKSLGLLHVPFQFESKGSHICHA
jgi:D-glycero-alpha-D-manno-heptose-7-phosphate kinase